jgi:4-amino-4-deoxychorismate lyase
VTKLLETIKAVDGEILHLKYHQDRLNRSMAALGYDAHYELKELLDPPETGSYRCRVVYDNHTIDICYLPYSTKKIRSLKVVHDDTIEYALKYHNRDALNTLFQQRAQCDDVLIIKNGYVTDSTIANVAFYDGKRWLTPKNPLLKGTTRQRLLDSSWLVERAIKVTELKNYQQSALFNALMGFVELEDGIIF